MAWNWQIAAVIVTDTQTCAQVLERIVAIVSERAPRGAAAAADQFLGSLGGSGSREGGGRDSGGRESSGSRRQEPPASRRDSSSREDPEVSFLGISYLGFTMIRNIIQHSSKGM